MALIQSMTKQNFKTFDDFGYLIIKKINNIFHQFQGVNLIVLTFDIYGIRPSLKQFERERRGETFINPKEFEILGTTMVPNLVLFLKSTQNKKQLTLFIGAYFEQNFNLIENDKKLWLTGCFKDVSLCKEFTKNTISIKYELSCYHEEADTRMVFFATYFNGIVDNLIIKSDDTDVLVILLHQLAHKNIPANIFLLSGHKGKFVDRERFVFLADIISSISLEISRSLPAFHALTGSDTTSSFFKYGKSKCLDTLMKNFKDLKELQYFGKNSIETDIKVSTKFALLLYKAPKNTKTMNDLRHYLLIRSKKNAEDLPPTDDALEQHVLRARIQCIIWVDSDKENAIINFNGQGWSVDDQQNVKPIYTKKDIAPKKLQNILNTFCADKYCRSCVCLKNDFRCTDFCKCFAHCQNRIK